jgi:hypothetical protein
MGRAAQEPPQGTVAIHAGTARYPSLVQVAVLFLATVSLVGGPHIGVLTEPEKIANPVPTIAASVPVTSINLTRHDNHDDRLIHDLIRAGRPAVLSAAALNALDRKEATQRRQPTLSIPAFGHRRPSARLPSVRGKR